MRDLDDIFALQDEISQAVVAKLRVALLSSEVGALVGRPTKSLEAYQTYLQGRHFRFTRYKVMKALACFELAARQDPSYAGAWAGVADAAVAAGVMSYLPSREAWTRARTAVEQALALDDSLSEAHAAHAKVLYRFECRWDDAGRAFERAIERNPMNTHARCDRALFLSLLRDTDEALEQLARAREVDPLSAYAIALEGEIQLLARHYEKAITCCLEALELQPDLSNASWYLINTYLVVGRPEEAIQAFRGYSTTSPIRQGLWALALASAGRLDEAKQVVAALQERRQKEYVAPYALALAFLGLGDADAVITHLEEAYEERNPVLAFLGTLPMWDVFRSDARFRDLVRRVGPPGSDQPGLYR